MRSQSTLLTGVSVSIDGDNTVDVVFDVVEEKTLPIQVTTNYLKIADGYILYGTDISKETVTLSGPSTELSQVETCTAEVTYNGEHYMSRIDGNTWSPDAYPDGWEKQA